MNQKHNLSLKTREAKAKRCYTLVVVTIACCAMMITPAFATDDPLTAIDNLTTFVFSAIQAIGVIILGWGVVQIGMSLQSHDPSQRSNGFLSLFGGLMITFAKEILDLILA